MTLMAYSTSAAFFMALLICLPTVVQCTSPFKNDSESLQMKLNRPMPDLAPFEENERVKPLGGLEYTHRLFLQQIFSKAFYSFCNRKITVKPIYFWPGDRVDLPCTMCDRHDAFNGRMKYWSFARQRFFERFHNLAATSKDLWTVLDELATRRFRLPNEALVFMPMENPRDANRLSRFVDENHQRPNMTFVQRDGRLKILNAETNAYGLYRCFDDSDREKVEIVYYLIPIVPLFIMEHAQIYRYECKMTKWRDNQASYERFDSMHRFHVVAPTMWDLMKVERNYVPDHWRGQDYADAGFPPPQTGVVYVLPPIVSKKVEISLNLQVFVHWSPWSACDSRRRYRTRRGYCHIGKVKTGKVFELTDLQRKILMARDLEMFIILHRLFDTVDEFKRHGIPLFSGVMYHLITDRDERWPVAQCTNLRYDKFEKRTIPDRLQLFHDYIIEPIKAGAYHVKATGRRGDATTRIYETACFYLNETDTPTTVLYGFPMNQNERC